MMAVEGRSVVEQLLDHLEAHESSEGSMLPAYERAATTTPDEGIRFLMGLVLEDEERHHKLMSAMAKDVRQSLLWLDGETPLPSVDPHPVFRDALRAQTEEFLRVERDGMRHLEELERAIKQIRSGMLELIVDTMLADSRKHIRILEFIMKRLEDELA